MQRTGGIRHDVKTDWLVELYLEGWSIRRIGCEVSMSYHAIYGRLERAGVQFRARGKPAPVQCKKPPTIEYQIILPDENNKIFWRHIAGINDHVDPPPSVYQALTGNWRLEYRKARSRYWIVLARGKVDAPKT